MIEDLPEEFPEESPLRKLIKKTIIRTIAIILVILFLSYFLGYYALNFIQSRLESEKLDESFITKAGDKTIIFEKEAYEELNKIYFDNLEHEFKACLLGSIEGRTYVIKKVIQPEIFSQSSFHVSAKNCPQGTLIHLHTHPFQRCIASDTDIKNLEILKKQSPMAIMAVMCEKDRFSFYT